MQKHRPALFQRKEAELKPAPPRWQRDSTRRCATIVVACASILLSTHRCLSQHYDYEDSVYPSYDQHEAAAAGLRPRWIFRGGAVYMNRKREDPLVLFQNTASLGEQINAEDFDFDSSVGIDASLSRKLWDESGFEVRYLDLGRVDAAALSTSAPSSWSINATPPVFAPNVQAVQAVYDSDFFGFETNYHYWFIDWFTLFGGLRYVSFDERLAAVMEAPPQTFTYDTSTRNDLYGVQIGVNCAPSYPYLPWLVPSAFAKIGVYGNDARQHSLLNTGATTLAVRESESVVAWLGELGVSAAIQFNHGISVHGGYGMIWIENVSIASEQVPASDFFNATGIDNRGSAIFYGANLAVSLEI